MSYSVTVWVIATYLKILCGMCEIYLRYRFGGVVVITSALHAEGLGFEPRPNLLFFFLLPPPTVNRCCFFSARYRRKFTTGIRQ